MAVDLIDMCNIDLRVLDMRNSIYHLLLILQMLF